MAEDFAIEDFAIIIGLQKYPGLEDLEGSENDAKKFETWVTSEDGGRVPEANVKLILSSKYDELKDRTKYYDAKPAFQEIKSAFQVLKDRSLEMDKRGLGRKIGRRLYIFMSGHGITPSQFGINSKEIGLLMSNVNAESAKEFGSHIPGRNVADWFCENEFFDEVFLFMDCCRDNYPVIQTYPLFAAEGTSNKATRCYAFATKWGFRAKERIIDGKPQGVFTKALLLALEGACADFDPKNPVTGKITGASLKSFLIQNTKAFLDPNYLENNDNDVPDIDLVSNSINGDDILIKQVPLQKFPVIVKFSSLVTGPVDIVTGAVIKIEQIQITNPTDELHLSLPRGAYLMQKIENGAIVRTDQFFIRGIEKIGSEAKITLQFQ